MKMEIVLTKDEVHEVLHDSVEESEKTLIKRPEGSGWGLVLEFKPVPITHAELVSEVLLYYEIPEDSDMVTESVVLLPDGGVGITLVRKKK